MRKRDKFIRAICYYMIFAIISFNFIKLILFASINETIMKIDEMVYNYHYNIYEMQDEILFYNSVKTYIEDNGWEASMMVQIYIFAELIPVKYEFISRIEGRILT